jgi:DNA-directed RNA polymerase alpha subunit
MKMDSFYGLEIRASLAAKLRNIDIESIDQLASKTRLEMSKYRGFGIKTVDKIEAALIKHGKQFTTGPTHNFLWKRV